MELVDQRLDLVALVAEERGLGGGEERQALDPLRGPLGADLGGRHAPHLLGVGHEEVLVEPLAEAVGDPLLEVVLAALGLDRGPQVGEQAARELDRAELLDHVLAVERVVEELAAPVDPRHARPAQELLLHHLVPEVVDLLGLGEEAVAAEIEAVAVANLGLRDASDLILRLEHDDGTPLFGEQISSREAGRAAAEDSDRLLGPEPTRSVGRRVVDRGHGPHLARTTGVSRPLLKAANRP